jgi:hypothetical protein
MATTQRDLADNRPGSAARAKARELEAEHPVKAVLARLLGVRRPEHAWHRGADGEVLVGRTLRRLGPRWGVLHSVPVGTRGSDIDHVVVGRAGVFTLNTKHHRRGRIQVDGDRLVVNGTRQAYVRASRHEATRAAKLLAAAGGVEVPVRAIVVPVGAAAVRVRRQAVDVAVVERRHLRRWLGRQPEVLTASQVDAVYDLARRPSTWVG